MNRQKLVLGTLFSALSWLAGPAAAADVTVSATSKSTVVAGPYVRSGVTLTTSPAALTRHQDYAKKYDGATEFKVDYTIKLKPDGTLDTGNSTATFITVTYTDLGKEVKSSFTTLPIKITGVTMGVNPPPTITGFSFSSTDWYPPTANGAGLLDNNGLSGSINLATGDSFYKASYRSKADGAIFTYDVSGKIKPPAPLPPPLPTDMGTSEIFAPTPIPEPATLALMLAGLAVIAWRGSLRRAVPAR